MAEHFRRGGIPLRVVLVALLLAGLVLVLTLAAHAGGGKARGVALGPEGVPVPPAPPLAAPGSPAPGRSVDGIACGSQEQLAFHIHAHLTIFVRGAARTVPPGIGIAPPLEVQRTAAGLYAAGGQCFSYLHTHAADGIIHIESPIQRVYTLGDFFDVWHQPLGRARVGAAVGPVAGFLDGRPWAGDPRAIPLHAHAQIQLDVGQPVVAPQSIVFPGSL
jgi:hypothetical protein